MMNDEEGGARSDKMREFISIVRLAFPLISGKFNHNINFFMRREGDV
jgi:hypothetical protein